MVTLAVVAFLRVLDRLNDSDRLNYLDRRNETNFVMRLRQRPFPWVAPRACATSARLTAR